ncbi:serine/threonine-protein kinase [Nonomuraea sp. NPDC050404]|uniref:serine/threonine-protein kinase n=1 Tax=Nonomuraea sp. NPDC050404 TaxID=3155783 RepID=UPI0033EE3281
MSDENQQIGPYTIMRRLGAGGMGIVYLARLGDAPPVALKVLRPGADDDFRRRFTREVEAARSVARFCTAPVLDAGIDGETAYLVTEYVDGPDLAEVIRERGPMAGANLEALAVGVATALTAIHQAGVVHRDLKPANILLSTVGPRVIDFGIAQLVTPDATKSATIVGTPAYMSPEQATGEQVTTASDVFAWGGVVVYAATGKAPFGVGGAPEVLYRVVHYAPDLGNLDERLRPLVEQALAKDPARRPTPQQLLDRLLGRESINMAAAMNLVSESWMPTEESRVWRAKPARSQWARSRWVRPAAAITAALLVAAGSGMALWRPWDPAPAASAAGTGTSPTSLPVTSVPTTTGLATRNAFVTNADGERVPVQVSIDKLTRWRDLARLEWTVKNFSTKEQSLELFHVVGSGWDVHGVTLDPDGSGKALQPIYTDGECTCTYWASYANAIGAGESQAFFAEFRGIPDDATKASLDLLELGDFKGIPIEDNP